MRSSTIRLLYDVPALFFANNPSALANTNSVYVFSGASKSMVNTLTLTPPPATTYVSPGRLASPLYAALIPAATGSMLSQSNRPVVSLKTATSVFAFPVNLVLTTGGMVPFTSEGMLTFTP